MHWFCKEIHNIPEKRKQCEKPNELQNGRTVLLKNYTLILSPIRSRKWNSDNASDLGLTPESLNFE
jgi:hypothetical protein